MSTTTHDPAVTPRTTAFQTADSIQVGDLLPEVSRQPVSNVVVFPHESVRVVFGGGEYVRHFPWGGPDFGYPAVTIARSADA